MARNDESKIQAAIVQWVRTVAPDCRIFAVPNGAHVASKRHAALLVWTGLTKGVPDLVVLCQGGRAVFIEVKAPKGSVSNDQRAFLIMLQSLGFQTAVVRSIDDVRLAFEAWRIETREVANA